MQMLQRQQQIFQRRTVGDAIMVALVSFLFFFILLVEQANIEVAFGGFVRVLTVSVLAAILSRGFVVVLHSLWTLPNLTFGTLKYWLLPILALIIIIALITQSKIDKISELLTNSGITLLAVLLIIATQVVNVIEERQRDF